MRKGDAKAQKSLKKGCTGVADCKVRGLSPATGWRKKARLVYTAESPSKEICSVSRET